MTKPVTVEIADELAADLAKVANMRAANARATNCSD